MAKTLELLQKVVTTGHDWKKDDLLDAILYIRCVAALIAGTSAGSLGLEGFYIFLGYVGFNYSFGRMWLGFQGVEATDYEPAEGQTSAAGPIWFEGFPQSLTLFVLSWVISYSIVGSA